MKKFYIKLGTCALLLVCLAGTGSAQSDLASMSVNVGFDANGQLMRTDSAALTVWGKVLVLNRLRADQAIPYSVDMSKYPGVLDYLLWVEKGGLATWFRYNDVDTWADYVFDPGYELMPLEQVEAFVTSNRHLPGVPSVGELREKGGYSMKVIDRLTLEKLEALTLYMIDQEKYLADMEKAAPASLESIEARLHELELSTTEPKPGNHE